MRYALIENNTVVNVILADPDFDPGLTKVLLEEGDVVGVGYVYDGTNFIKPDPKPPSLEDKKAARYALVDKLIVTTTSGKTFDGNEDAQNRMNRAINSMDELDSTLWVLADNQVVEVSRTELREVLRLSGIAMTTIWMMPYQ